METRRHADTQTRRNAVGPRVPASACLRVPASRLARVPASRIARVPASARLRVLGCCLGFTLLELMIVITVIIILAAVVLPQYQKTILHTREAVLRDDLFKLRQLIDQYAADKGKLPQSLDELVTDGYLRELPVDPFTGEKDWTIVTGDDPHSTGGEQGVTDVHSASSDVATDGRPYSEW